jgi:hypothetical protein
MSHIVANWPFFLLCAAALVWILWTCREKPRSPTDSYTADCRKRQEERARRAATKFLEERARG